MIKYVVTYIEYGNGSDLHTHILGTYPTRRDAEVAMEMDMEDFGERLGIYYAEESGVWASPDDKWKDGCEWKIREVSYAA